MSNKPVYVVFGMTGAGKTAVCDAIAKRIKINRLKNTTTRPKRGPEDTEYNFCKEEDFLADNGRYIAVRKYHTFIEDTPKYHYYGVDKLELEKGGLLITDFEGFKELLERDLPVIGIYIHADTQTRLERAKMRSSFKLEEFERRNADDLVRFNIQDIIKVGKEHAVYLIDNSGNSDIEDVADRIQQIIINHK